MRKKKGPWVVTATRIVYKNRWITVREDDVIQPDGKPGVFGTMMQKGGSSVIAMDEKQNVYLTKEYHYAVGRITLEAVGGGTESRETWLQTAKRELKEETGLTARRWTYLGVVDPLTTSLSSPNHMYLARDLTFGEAKLDATETLTIVKIPFTKAFRMMKKGTITHAATVVALLRIANIIGTVAKI